jgi:PAS domain S-box-containing protein
MTRNLMRRAFRWAGQLEKMPRLNMNVSPSQFRDIALVSQIGDLIAEGHFPAGLLTVEITETAVLENPEMAGRIARALKELGCRLSLDDFGTGYSSLALLQAFPFDELKLDRSFVQAMVENRANRKIVAAVLGLGHSLGLKTVGEGVETEEQAEMLLRLGCNLGQGWLYGRPSGGQALPAIVAARPTVLCLQAAFPGDRTTPVYMEAMPAQQGSQLHAIYESAPVGLGFLNKDLRYVSINRYFAEMNGAPVEAFFGKTPEEMIPALHATIGPYLVRALQGERITDLELERPATIAGDPNRMTLSSYEPVVGEAGEVMGVSVTVVDITKRKQAEMLLRESDERYRGMMETSPSTLWVLDADGKLIDAGASWFAMTGQTREEGMKRGFLDALHPDDKERAAAVLLKSLATGKLIDIEVRAVAAGGGWRWMRTRGAPRYGASGAILRWNGTTEDVHDRKMETERLRKRVIELEYAARSVAGSEPFIWRVFPRRRARKTLIPPALPVARVGHPLTH